MVDGVNVYTYVMSNPTRYGDSSGLQHEAFQDLQQQALLLPTIVAGAEAEKVEKELNEHAAKGNTGKDSRKSSNSFKANLNALRQTLWSLGVVH